MKYCTTIKVTRYVYIDMDMHDILWYQIHINDQNS